MNKKLLVSVVLLNLSIMTLQAQITIRGNDVVEKAVFKPQQFDSLSNIGLQRHPIDYKKFIGYKVFFLPKSKNYKPQYSSSKEKIIDFLFTNDTIMITKDGKIPFEQTAISKISGNLSIRKKDYDNIDKEKTNIYLPHFYHERTDNTDGEIFGKIGTLSDSIEGKYFTILDIQAKEPYGSKDYKNLEDVDYDENKILYLGLKIILRNESNKDTLFWIVNQARDLGEPFFLVPYFEKQRRLYLNQNLVLKYSDRINSKFENMIDVNTGLNVNIKYGEVWTCTDVSFTDSKDSYYLNAFYFIKNGEREVKIKLGSELISEYFMLEAEFKNQELEKKKNDEEKRREEQERQKIKQEEKSKFRSECIAKWGQKMGGYIADGKVVLGMNKEMCIAAWGNPIEINRTILQGLTSEQWVFGWKTYLYFDNGVLSAIQD